MNLSILNPRSDVCHAQAGHLEHLFVAHEVDGGIEMGERFRRYADNPAFCGKLPHYSQEIRQTSPVDWTGYLKADRKPASFTATPSFRFKNDSTVAVHSAG